MPMFPHILVSLLAITRFKGIFARHNGYRHEAVDIQKRLDPIASRNVTEQCPAPTPPLTIYSVIFPSPDATPVVVTTQSQVVTSFLPEMTWCVGAPLRLVPIPVFGIPYANRTTTDYTAVAEGTGYCETHYVPTTTTVCATTLTGIASKITVSECDQEITFSSECGYEIQTPTPTSTFTSNGSALVTITPAPTVQRMMTYWLAPWQSLTAGDTPSDVDIKVCRVIDTETQECTRYQEVWEVVTVTQTSTSSYNVTLTTTVSGPGTLIVETRQVFVTNTIKTVDLSTTLLVETEVEIESTSKGTRLTTKPGIDIAPQTSTLYVTKHVKYRTSQSPEPTTTIRQTSHTTQHVGTITLTRPRGRLIPTLPANLDF